MIRLPRYVLYLAFVFCLPSILLGCASSSTENIRSSVHLIEKDGGNGSGVMIQPFLMLTAAHVVGDGLNLTVGPNKLPAKLLYIDKDVDIALLHVAVDCPCAPLANPPEIGEKVLLVGFPIHEHIHLQIVTEGTVQGLWERKLMTTAPAAGGNSGGGVFVYQDGEWRLAGILIQVAGWCMGGFTCYPMPHLSRAVDTLTMTQFVDRAAW